ncbi:MAG: Piwi domain-containing protein [Candidatus Helarchaeota archaeon]
MSKIETNIYIIENLDDLKCNYRIYDVRGLSKDSKDYFKNIQLMTRRLSYLTNSPCIPFNLNENVCIAQPDEFSKLPKSLDLVRTVVKISLRKNLNELNFNNLNSKTALLAQRFLQFSLQNPLYRNPTLWQPKSGYPFYNKVPDQRLRKISKEIDVYHGFIFRIILLQKNKLGICVDVGNKYVSRNYLPTKITRDEFDNYKGRNCLYEFGTNWYEIKIHGLADQLCNEIKIPHKGTLFEEIQSHAGPNPSPSLLELPEDSSVIFYLNNRNERRNVPTGLCRLIFSTNHPEIKFLHNHTMKKPHIRRHEIKLIVNKYLRDLKFGEFPIELSENPLIIPNKQILVPDLLFGNNKILSVRKTPGTIFTPLKDFGKKKKELFYSSDAGIYRKKIFDRQYLILPKSFYLSFGKSFIDDLKREVNRFFTNENRIQYSPNLIIYNDSVQSTIYNLGREILKAVEESGDTRGYGIVMIPKLPSEKFKKEDELANLLMVELRKKDLFVSIIHTTVPQEYFNNKSKYKDKNSYDANDKKIQKRYNGYIKNVAINKVLLLNEFWPFILSTPINADLIIGIDVKNNTAGFTLFYKDGPNIRFIPSESDQKEQLSEKHVFKIIYDTLREEQKSIFRHNIKNIVIHRDGKLYPSEQIGIRKAIERLSKKGYIDHNASVTFLEIKETSRTPVRLFEIKKYPSTANEKVSNPKIGIYFDLDNECYICNTGFPYFHQGTTNPLHIVKVDGDMAFKDLIEDVFYLSNLTWTKIDDCLRIPISIKLTDIRLREIAGVYDEDELKFYEYEE